jgi:hypothetical protein
MSTEGLYGFFVNDSRQYLTKRPFWVLTASQLAVHLFVFVFVLTHVVEWRLTWCIVMA